MPQIKQPVLTCKPVSSHVSLVMKVGATELYRKIYMHVGCQVWTFTCSFYDILLKIANNNLEAFFFLPILVINALTM